MANSEILGQLSSLQEMMRALLRGVPAAAANIGFHPRLACLSWYLGRSVYRETYWLREMLTGDSDLTERVRHLFAQHNPVADASCAQLPPPEHLLNWAAEIQDEHLRRLATPGALPAHPLLEADRLQWFLLQEAARDYESMLSVLLARSLAAPALDYRITDALRAQPPQPDAVDVTQGHYRIGSRQESFAYDNELPPQAVELSGYRIARRPVTNAQYLAFLEGGGYERKELWNDEAGRWRTKTRTRAPWHWRRDPEGRYFSLGLNGPGDLPPDDPVSGVSQHEATAYAAWVASLGGDLAGAVLQHEYQWEVAARSGLIEGTGRVWEWCSNPLHPYPDFSPFPGEGVSSPCFGGDYSSLRGASLHTQRCLRRASFRNWAQAADHHRITGIRLVFPPA